MPYAFDGGVSGIIDDVKHLMDAFDDRVSGIIDDVKHLMDAFDGRVSGIIDDVSTCCRRLMAALRE